LWLKGEDALLVNFKEENPYIFDIIIIGSGISGLFAALKAARFARVCLLTKGRLSQTNTSLAQGGIAVALGDNDSPRQHLTDTLKAGAGLSNPGAVTVMVEEGPRRVQELLKLGVPFDCSAEGRLVMSREGAHRRSRVLHAGGDATGRLIQETLQQQLLSHKSITVHENIFVTEILTSDSGVRGVKTLKGDTYLAAAIILATGGLGRIFSLTTNPEIATGDGVAMAYRAGARIADLEFVQFHPTVLQRPREGGAFLLSEALRGEGAILRNCHGKQFMSAYHEMADLGPRDVVSRAIVDQMARHKSPNVFLDITHHEAAFLQKRFPTIYYTLKEYGLDMARDLLPVTPAAHYAMGGVYTGVDGDTSLPGLYACGEVACSTVHGANRLASNSLLEGLVFAARAVEQIERKGFGALSRERESDGYAAKTFSVQPSSTISKLGGRLRRLMFEKVGLLRSRKGLLEAEAFIKENADILSGAAGSREAWELKNMFLVAGFIVSAALLRTESRGSHYRLDYPEPDPNWLCHLYFSRQAQEGKEGEQIGTIAV
jgi:L-aspartate oxidase